MEVEVFKSWTILNLTYCLKCATLMDAQNKAQKAKKWKKYKYLNAEGCSNIKSNVKGLKQAIKSPCNLTDKISAVKV